MPTRNARRWAKRLHGRGLCARPAGIRPHGGTAVLARQARRSVDGFLYGAPAADLSLEARWWRRPPSARLSGYVFGLSDRRSQPRASSSATCRRPARTQATFDLELADIPDTGRPLEARIAVRMAKRRPRRRAQADGADRRGGDALGVKPTFGPRARRRRERDLDDRRHRGRQARARNGALGRSASRRASQWYRQNGSWEFEPVKQTTRVASTSTPARTRPASCRSR